MAAHVYEFGSFAVDSSRRLLLRDGEPVALAPKALETLLALIENRERVVTKDELMKLVWGDTIVEEGGLARNISVLRKALGERPDHHQYIVTAPGRGYRFVAEIRERSENGDAPVLPQPATFDKSLQRGRAFSPRQWQILAGLTAAAIGILYLLTRSYATDCKSFSPEACDEYQIGRYLLWKGVEKEREKAVSHFKRATELDPGYADAHASLALAWLMRATMAGVVPIQRAEPAARAAVREALRLDSRLADAHVAQGVLHWFADKNWREGEKEFRRALELDSDNLAAHQYYSYILMYEGRTEEAIIQVQSAERLEPLSGIVQEGFGRVMHRAGKYHKAIEYLNRAIELEPQNGMAHLHLGEAYEQLGQYDKAEEYFVKGKAMDPRDPKRPGARLAGLYARTGRQSEARSMLEEIRRRNSQNIDVAGAWSALGDNDEAFKVLFSLVEKGPLPINDPRLGLIREDPRWKELVSRINYPTSPPD